MPGPTRQSSDTADGGHTNQPLINRGGSVIHEYWCHGHTFGTLIYHMDYMSLDCIIIKE